MTFLLGLSLVVAGVSILALIVAGVSHEVEMLRAARRERRRLAPGKRRPMVSRKPRGKAW